MTDLKLDILAIGAHPDDVELGCAGVIAKEADRGKKIGILDLTRGELSTRGTIAQRQQEANRAAQIMGVCVRENLGFNDGFIVNDQQHQLEVIKIIRKYRPQLVLCNAVFDRHPDHGVASQLASKACFLSGLRKIETQINGTLQPAWRPDLVYHYIQWQDMQPDVVVDISDYINHKIDAVAAYQSQFYDPRSNEPQTPISSKNFMDSVSYRAANLGRYIGTDYAEGFITERYAGVDSLFNLI